MEMVAGEEFALEWEQPSEAGLFLTWGLCCGGPFKVLALGAKGVFGLKSSQVWDSRCLVRRADTGPGVGAFSMEMMATHRWSAASWQHSRS